jgi:hypothetical protein
MHFLLDSLASPSTSSSLIYFSSPIKNMLFHNLDVYDTYLQYTQHTGSPSTVSLLRPVIKLRMF